MLSSRWTHKTSQQKLTATPTRRRIIANCTFIIKKANRGRCLLARISNPSRLIPRIRLLQLLKKEQTIRRAPALTPLKIHWQRQVAGWKTSSTATTTWSLRRTQPRATSTTSKTSPRSVASSGKPRRRGTAPMCTTRSSR